MVEFTGIDGRVVKDVKDVLSWKVSKKGILSVKTGSDVSSSYRVVFDDDTVEVGVNVIDVVIVPTKFPDNDKPETVKSMSSVYPIAESGRFSAP